MIGKERLLGKYFMREEPMVIEKRKRPKEVGSLGGVVGGGKVPRCNPLF